MTESLSQTLIGILIPFAGTALGAASVFFMRGALHPLVQKALLGFASGVMVAASVWSLLIPAMDMSEGLGRFAFFPAMVGLLLGFLFLLVLDRVIPHMHIDLQEEGPHTSLKKNTMLVLAVTLHNIPEGMAVGVVFAGWLSGNADMSFAGALALALGIAIQNFPEGAIISMPLYAEEGRSRVRAFRSGLLSGIVEPIGALLTILLSAYIVPLLPYLLAFAAGAMLYVVVEELIPESNEGAHSNIGTIGFAVGFALMMVLDVALG